jgi:hypothetical protein
MTSAAFRQLALSLRFTEERAHMSHPDFRVAGKIFATMGYPRAGWAMVSLTPEDQTTFVQMEPEAFVPVKGKWGERGATNIILRHARVPAVRAALRAAHEAHLPPPAARVPAAASPRKRRDRRAT